MNIDLKSMSDADIAQLLQAVASELSARLVSQPAAVMTAPAKPAADTASLRPDKDDRDFALRIATKLRRGDFVKALERERIAEIAQRFPEWIKAQDLPAVSNHGVWKRLREFYSVAQAPEQR